MTDPITSPAPRGPAPVARVLPGDGSVIYSAHARDGLHWPTVEVRTDVGADRVAAAVAIRAAIGGLREYLATLTRSPEPSPIAVRFEGDDGGPDRWAAYSSADAEALDRDPEHLATPLAFAEVEVNDHYSPEARAAVLVAAIRELRADLDRTRQGIAEEAAVMARAAEAAGGGR